MVVETQHAASLRVGYMVEANRPRHLRLRPEAELPDSTKSRSNADSAWTDQLEDVGDQSGYGPVSIGLLGSLDHSDQEPAYNLTPWNPA